MVDIDDILEQMRTNPAGVRFSDLKKICEHYFGPRTNKGTSHQRFKTPWTGDPRVNIQPGKGNKAKSYQVGQVLDCIQRLNEITSTKKVEVDLKAKAEEIVDES